MDPSFVDGQDHLGRERREEGGKGRRGDMVSLDLIVRD